MTHEESNKETLTELVSDFLHTLDDKFTPTSEGYVEASVMFASLFAGANEALIAQEMQYDPEIVDLVGNRLRTAGIWSGGEIDPRAMARWDGEDGGVAMLCDMNVAIGSFLVAKYNGDEPAYQMSPSGKAHVERMLSVR